MNAPDVQAYLVRDVSPQLEGGGWAGPRPSIRAAVPAAGAFRFIMNLVVPEAVLAKTGPITVAFAVDGRVLGKALYTTAGEKTFEKPVPPGLLTPGDLATLSAESDKTIAAGDGRILSFILTGAGFKP
jgi:hypothetical protein